VTLTKPGYGDAMIDNAAQSVTAQTVEDALNEDLAHGDNFVMTVTPILRHLVSSNEHSVFGDEIIARVRGMLAHIASQLLDAVVLAEGETERAVHPDTDIHALAAQFADDEQLLSHLHAIAMEWQLTERLSARLSVDPVLSPLMQALIAAPEAGTAGLAMALMASQARFTQSQRRMELPLGELPGDILHSVLQALDASASPERAEHVRAASHSIRSVHDEARSRIGLMARLISGLGAGATAALGISHAGAALFLSALALASGQDRETVVLSTNEGQVARLSLALRASGLRLVAIAEQVAALHPDIAMPDDFDDISPDRAAAMLASSAVLPRR